MHLDQSRAPMYFGLLSLRIALGALVLLDQCGASVPLNQSGVLVSFLLVVASMCMWSWITGALLP
jgi:hypothetical protein